MGRASGQLGGFAAEAKSLESAAMSHLRVIFAFVLTCLGASAALAPAHAALVSTQGSTGGPGHIQVELVPASASAAPGGVAYVALRQKIAAGWHTYWRNPGDAGDPPQIKWTLPPGWSAGEVVWPLPRRLPAGPLMDYGYEGEVYLPVPITAPASARIGQSVRIEAAVSILVCKDVCIPEDAKLALALPVANSSGRPNPAVMKVIEQAPKPAGLKAALSREGGAVKISVAGPALKGTSGSGAYFYPFDSTAIDHAKPQGVERGPEGLTLTLQPGYAFQKPDPPKALAGVLAVDGAAYEIDAREGSGLAGAAGLGGPTAAARPGGGGSGLGLPMALAFAFLGGVILNLMPCVFPVLAMKAAALAGHAGEAGRARAHGLAYGAGVVATFLALAGGLIAARAGGEAVGWGYQLQSPAVTAALSLLMLLIALNLSGLYEVGISAQGLGGSLAGRGGLAGAFFTGALAVVVAAPCTAPFMAVAIGWAFTQPPLVTLLVFLMLGLGLAAPFLALSFAPALIARLPRPGAWMDVLRRALAFPMYGAAAWLAWVMTAQGGQDALARLLAAALALALGAWLYGLGQRGAGRGRWWQAAAVPALAAAAVLVYPVAAGMVAASSRASSGAPGSAAAGLAAVAYSPAKLQELRSQGKVVFVDFTADWCLTCKVNERGVLSTPAVVQAFAKSGAVYMVADWTNRNADIAKALAEHGRAGVPLYLVYPARSGEAAILPQLLTEGAVTAAIQEAAAS
jgi:thiol:disulfide interchange protein